MNPWTCALALNTEREITGGSEQALADSIRKGSDLRICTEFRHNEHIDVTSDSPELIREVAQFGLTYLVDDRWSAGIMSLRQPVNLPNGFGLRSSMSFFLYNQDGNQAIGRPYLDGVPVDVEPGESPVQGIPNMPKYHALNNWDAETNAPSSNFIYNFEKYEFCVSNSWEEVLSHNSDGQVRSGSIEALGDAFSQGCAIKVAVSGLCSDLAEDQSCMNHEVFVETGSGYYYLDQKLFVSGSHPVVRIQPGTPMQYRSRNWDFGWLVLRTDGKVVYRRCDPYTLKFEDRESNHPVRWFVR